MSDRKKLPATVTKAVAPAKTADSASSQAPREAMMMIVCGMKGVGKTFRTLQEIKLYLRPADGRLGRKVLVHDVNAPLERSYETFQTVDIDDVHRLQAIEPRRVVPLNKNGSPMTIEQKQEALYKILTRYTKGLVVMEDINNYLIGAKSIELIGAITTNRHRDLDLIIHLQSLSAVDPRMWQNATCIRFHKQLDAIDRYRKRIPNFELMKLAQLIVEDQYQLGNRRFFVYVMNLDNKIRGTNEKWFRRACEKYLAIEKTELRMLLDERDERGNKKHDYSSAVEAFVQSRLHYITFNQEK